ncbi:MAG TPA: tRNA (adenosine(37)-N6)-threonylcarbamoyltransferase complex ATPase subunit type 1 TsaE [Thermodesulfobacteriota bacterium]|nr:tRNA (adenosine(37)-N6)-threonylcarbamoyltransferase complex ATPase subunit type 1 TsaE [Thermodesulfobacteriota bacterium]
MFEKKQGQLVFQATSESADQTVRLGRILGALLPEGSFVALVGGLGAGKTVLTKGIAQGLGVADEREVTSPSFVLVNEYRGRVPVYHVDLYRLENPSEVEGIGWDEIISGPAVTLVEWADKAEKYLPEERMEIHLEWAGEKERRILLCGKGQSGQKIIEQLQRKWMKEE